MNYDGNALAPRTDGNGQRVIEIGAPAAAESPPQASGTNWPAAVHSLLRGRYHWALLLALVGMVAGSVLGYRVVPVRYRSAGMIRIRSNIAPVIYQTERNGVVPNFEGFMDSQLTLLSDQLLIESAMKDPEWRKFDRGDSPEAVADFISHLTVTRPDGSELIVVAYVDRDAEAAMAAVKAVIGAYERQYVQGDVENMDQRMKVLEGLQNKYETELATLNKQILDIAHEFGSDSLAPVYDFRLQQLQKLESDLTALQLQVSALGGQADGAGSTTRPAVAPSPEQIAAADPQMRQLLNQRAALRREIEVLLGRLGSQHPEVRDKQRELDAVEHDIDQLYRAYADQSPASVATSPLGQLRAREDAVRSMYETAKRDTFDVGRKNLQILALRDQADQIRTKLTETRQRIESLNVESSISNRVSVVSYGEPPLGPYKDRRLAAAGAGGAGGAALGVGSLLLLCLLDRRVRGVADAQLALGSDMRLLGILPDLSGAATGQSVRLLAAHEVHCIRAALQDPTSGWGHQAFAVTSPGSRDGKTSLTLALGHSFAKTGARTLLVDFDLIGRNLSSRMDFAVRPTIGRILRQFGRVTREQMRDALRAAADSDRRVGEILVERGVITPADVERALEYQSRETLGLADVLGGRALEECTVATGIENLYMLPVGRAGAHHIAELSPNVVRRIVEAARGSYDTIIFDTGPILGSLEARLIAAQVDQVLLAISHGSHRPIVNQAVTQLRATGARLAGVVFNRARAVDLLSSTSTASIRSQPAAAQRLQAVSETEAVDVVATAVASALHRRSAPPTAPPEADGNGSSS